MLYEFPLYYSILMILEIAIANINNGDRIYKCVDSLFLHLMIEKAFNNVLDDYSNVF